MRMHKLSTWSFFLKKGAVTNLTRSFILSISVLMFKSSPVGAEETKRLDREVQPKVLTEVIFLGTIHGKHLKSKSYSLGHLEEILRKIHPEIICTEIVPESLKRFDSSGKDGRLSLFPEYTKVILPLREELKYEVIPCSAYSKKINFRTVGVEKMTEAHSKKIAEALDECKGQGKKVLVTFGSGHINGLMKYLKIRKDIKIVDFRADKLK